MSFVNRIKQNKKIRKRFESLYYWFAAFGLEPIKLIYSLKGFVVVLREYFILKKQNKNLNYKLRFRIPCLGDRWENCGTTSGHYFHQDLLVARKIYETNPQKHVDVGSRTDGFVAHIATFREIEVFDVRPLEAKIHNMNFIQADLMKPQNQFMNYCDSLSCLHALEHFGLGRYGDPIDIQGHIKGFNNLVKILKPKGALYFSVPIGEERIDFNGMRVFDISTILNLGKEHLLELESFSFVNDAGNLTENITLTQELIDTNCDCYYGCGIFEFIKKQLLLDGYI